MIERLPCHDTCPFKKLCGAKIVPEGRFTGEMGMEQKCIDGVKQALENKGIKGEPKFIYSSVKGVIVTLDESKEITAVIDSGLIEIR